MNYQKKINLLKELSKINININLQKKKEIEKEKENKINKKLIFDSIENKSENITQNIFHLKDIYSILQNKYNLSLIKID